MGRRTSALAALLLLLASPGLASVGIHQGPTVRFLSGHTVKRGPSASQWPSNIITVPNHYINANCTAKDVAFGTDRVDACTSAGNATPSLDGWDGADIQWALTQCELAGGCTIDLGCHTYTNAENTLYSTAPVLDHGRNGISYTAGFQRGLLFKGLRPGENGCAPGTILQSRLSTTLGPGYDDSFPTAAIFYLHQWDPAGAPTKGLPRVGFRNFECDGQSDKQPAPQSITGDGGIFLAGDAYQFHDCIQVNFNNVAGQYPYLEATGLNVHNFEGTGIHVADATLASVTNNTVTKIGCLLDYPGTGVGALPHVCDTAVNPWTSLPDTCLGGGAGCRPACTAQFTCPTCSTVWKNGTAVDGEVECGCASGQANCFGWMVAAEQNPVATQSPGLKTVASYGIIAEGRGRSVIQGNTVSYVTKYGIVHAYGTGGTTGTDEEQSTISGNTFHHNTIAIEAGTHSVDTSIIANTITQGGLNGNLCSSNIGIDVNGRHRQVVIDGNSISNIHCSGIALQTYEGYSGRVRDMIVANNTLTTVGDWAPIQASAGFGTLVWSPNQADAPCAAADLQFNTSLVVSNNTLNSGIHTLAGLQIARGLTLVCPANVANPVALTGNTIGMTDWAANINDLGRVLGLNITATGMTLNGDGTAGRTFTWLAGSTGTCSGFVKNGNPNPATVTDSSGNAIGVCP